MSKTTTHTEPEHVRRKIAEAFRVESENKRWKKKERTAFAHMAATWAHTLKKES